MTSDLNPQPLPPHGGDDYPVDLSVTRPDSQSRITNFPVFIGTLIRGFLLIPHLVILYFFQFATGIVYFIATFAILFTGRYPRGMFNFVAGYMRWNTRVSGYFFHLYDQYPPFSAEDVGEYTLRAGFQYPEQSSRLLNFPFLGQFIRLLLLTPHLLALAFLGVIALVVLFIAAFAILFTGSFPAGMHAFVTGLLRWSLRINSYLFGLTDRYPPFRFSS